MWTEKYKPTTAGDLVGNGRSIDQLKTWLESWKCYSDEVQHRDKKGGCQKKGKKIFVLYLYLFPQNSQHLESVPRFPDLSFVSLDIIFGYCSFHTFYMQKMLSMLGLNSCAA
jgi:hypothetical protein